VFPEHWTKVTYEFIVDIMQQNNRKNCCKI